MYLTPSNLHFCRVFKVLPVLLESQSEIVRKWLNGLIRAPFHEYNKIAAQNIVG